MAQRNMTIVPMAFGGPAPLALTLPWFTFGNVLDHAVVARLEIDTTLAPEQVGALVNLRLELLDGSTQPVQVSKVATIVLDNALAPGASMVLRLQADVTDNLSSGKRLEVGDALPVRLSFWLDQQLVTGYTYLLRVAPPEEVVLYMAEGVNHALYVAVRSVDTGAVGDLLMARSKRLVTRAREDRRAPSGPCAASQPISPRCANAQPGACRAGEDCTARPDQRAGRSARRDARRDFSARPPGPGIGPG